MWLKRSGRLGWSILDYRLIYIRLDKFFGSNSANPLVLSLNPPCPFLHLLFNLFWPTATPKWDITHIYTIRMHFEGKDIK